VVNHIIFLLASRALANSSSSSKPAPPPKFCGTLFRYCSDCMLAKMALSISASPPRPTFEATGLACTFLSIARAISSSVSLKPNAFDALGCCLGGGLNYAAAEPSPAPPANGSPANGFDLALNESPPTSCSTVCGTASATSWTEG